MRQQDPYTFYNIHKHEANEFSRGGKVPRGGRGVFRMFISAALILAIILVIVLVVTIRNNADKSKVENWEIGEDFYYDEYEDDYWGGEFVSMDHPIYFGATETTEIALMNSVKALKHYYGKDISIEEHQPIGLNYFTDEEIWLVITEYEPRAVGGGISFMINAKTGELSDYELEE
jgi:hypothetical protein